uniref:Ribosomal protein L12 n=1 Tax=Nitzschia sp. IriIs04 TaxID=1444690 RepID=A0A0S3QPJ1_9STRA|nr:ribosomal protein L12 [Nitzschia sp. IriIs04]BAT70256.1 ribosomal protein L12 [Nitzschia sp. IriIs04]
MTEKIDKFIENLKKLTLIEASELVKKIEETFNINTSSILTFDSNTSNNEKILEETAEKLEFNVSLDEVPKDKKISVLKVIRSITGLGLKEVKEIVDSVPHIIKENVNKETADSIKKQIEDAGGKISIK